MESDAPEIKTADKQYLIGMHHVIITLLLVFGSITMGAQDADTASINAQNIYAFGIHRENADTASDICFNVLTLSRQLSYLKGQGDAFVTLGAINRNYGYFIKSDSFFYEALSIRRNIGDSNRVAAVFINLGINCRLQARYDAAIAMVLKAIEILESASPPDHILSGSAYLLLSNIYDEYLEPKEALRYARKSLVTYVKTNNNELIGKASYAIGNRFHEQGALDSSLFYYDFAYNNFNTSSKDPDYIANILTNKAIVCTEMGNLEQAGYYYRQAEEVLEKLGEDADYFHLYLNKADWLIKQDQWLQALSYLKKAGSSEVSELNNLDKKFLFESLAKTYAGLQQNDSAYYYQLEAYTVRDSIYSENKRKEFIRFQTERYKKESVQQEFIAQQQTSRARQFLLATSLMSIIAIILIIAYIQRRKSYRIITQQREVLHKQAVDELIQNSELKFLHANIEGGETAKENIAKEIHDRLGSAMVTLTWQYESMLDHFPVESSEYRQMQILNGSLKNLYHDIRQIAHQLGSGVLERVGLTPVLEDLCQDIGVGNKIEVDFSSYGMEKRLSFFQEINILRIIQELVSNTLKYAAATRLSIQINQIKDVVNIIVEDNGEGFDLEDPQRRGTGIVNIENRVRALNGMIQFESQRQTGTTVILNIPVGNHHLKVETNP